MFAASVAGQGEFGLLGKIFLWFLLWHGAVTAARLGGWIGILLVAALAAGVFVYRRRHA